jgi:hypothetical protein
MGRYLDLLKMADQGGADAGACVQERQMTNHQNLQNPEKGGFDGFVGRSDGTRAHTHPAVGETPTDTAPPLQATRWLLHFAERDPLEVWFSPTVDHDEALAGYPDAVAAEPLLDHAGAHQSARESARPGAHKSAEESAQKSAARGCSTCRHRKRPGLSAGYCSGRDDLPGAYGEHHPLRQLPDDQGVSCASYLPHE